MPVVAGVVTGVHVIGTSVVMAYFRCPTSCPAIVMVVGKQREQHEQYNCQRHVICAAGGFHYAEIVQGEHKDASSLAIFAEPQPVLCKGRQCYLQLRCMFGLFV